MERVSIRDVRDHLRVILDRVAAGESFEVIDRGQPVAMILKPSPPSLAALERHGRVQRSVGDLLDLEPLPLPPGERRPSGLVSDGRGG
jgi:antitoxin (DNA-binding transcriptional repressor) of toxin-antitoxin stability system